MSEAEILASEISRLISRYGAKAVREEAKRLGKGQAGRPHERDYWLLKDLIEVDARDWLDGRNPLALRSNKSIASAIARQGGGQSPDATRRRIMRKLSSYRRAWMIVKAMWISELDRPFATYFQVASEVERLPDYADSIAVLIDLRRGALERYRERYGEPSPTMTILQIAEEAHRPPPASEVQSIGRLLFFGGDEISP